MEIRIILTGGGTAGHINPCLSVASYIKKRHPDAELLYIGKTGGMEERLVANAGLNFVGIPSSGIVRSLLPRGIVHNVKAAKLYFDGIKKTKSIIEKFRPNVVFGSGGYVSGAVMRAAQRLHIPTVTHEQNAFPGITTKLIAKRCDKILLGFEAARERTGYSDKCVTTGNPVREEIIFADRNNARRELGLKDGDFLILSSGGSGGAAVINDAVMTMVTLSGKNDKVFHIHSTGEKYYDDFMEECRDKIDLTGKRYDIRKFITNMPTCIAAADLIIGRAGAMTIAEITTCGKPAILIPSPNVTENHQYHNAMAVADEGGAIVIEEKCLTGELLWRTVSDLLSEPVKLLQMGKKARQFEMLDANKKIYEEIMKIPLRRTVR